MVKKFVSFVIVLILSFPVVSPLLHSGLIPTHDGEYHVVRFYEFQKAISEGVFFPRWASDLNFGYGVPLFNYVYPFPNYVGFLLVLFTRSFIDSFKLELLFSTLIGSMFFYLWTKKYWGD